MFSKAKQIIGVELGSACLKAAVIEFHEKNNGLLVREYAIQPIEGGSHDLVTSLGLLLSKLKTKCRECAVAAWPDSAIFRFLEHDISGSQDIRAVLNTGSNPHAAGDGLGDYILDFMDTGKGRQSEKGRLYVACGAPRKEIEAVRDLFAQLKYSIKLYQLTPIAVFNAFQASLDDAVVAKPFLAVDLGRRRSSLSGGDTELHLMRELAWGADDLQKALIDMGIIAPGQPMREMDVPLDKLKPALAEAIVPLARQLSMTIDYLRLDVESGLLHDVHVSGGLSTFDLFMDVLQEALGAPCIKWNPFRKMAATNAALKESSLLLDLFRLQAAAGAAVQYLT
jgi:Tfp pilus assembly PilM family ATPase